MDRLNTFNENLLKTVKFSNLKNWDVKNNLDKTEYKGKKKYFDKNIGYDVETLLEKFGLRAKISYETYLNDQKLLIGDDSQYKEQRVSFGSVQNLETFIDSEGFYDLSEEEQSTKYEEYLEDETNIYFDSHNTMDFSVFNHHHEDVIFALAEATQYLKLLDNTYPEVFKSPIIQEMMDSHNIVELKSYIEKRKIKITNKNIEILPTLARRLYKDSKFFNELKEYCKKHNYSYDELISKWLKIK